MSIPHFLAPLSLAGLPRLALATMLPIHAADLPTDKLGAVVAVAK